MNVPFADEYWQAVCTELETLEGMGDWYVFDCEDDMNVIRSTWGLSLSDTLMESSKHLKLYSVLVVTCNSK